MTASLPASFRVVDQRPETPVEKVRAVLGEAPWLNDPETWDRAKFVEQINQAFFDLHGNTVQLDGLCVGMLATQVDLYVKCWANIKTEGLVTSYNAGATPGKNLHIGIADRALRQVVNLLDELALTPKTRPPTKPTGVLAEFLKGVPR
jgi:hypothetical protein